jgi:hypothetical protein
MTAAAPVAKVYAAIAAVMSEIGKEGIAKDRKNDQQGYKFRGIDDVYNALSPILSRHNLCMLPRILSREVTERQTAKGNPLFFVTVEAEFDLISTEDGSKHTIRTYGEAMDSADKATNKAMSAAYKYAAMQAFAIPTEGDNDADGTTHEIVPGSAKPAAPKAMTKADAQALHDEIVTALQSAQTVADLGAMWKNWQPEIKRLPPDWLKPLTEFAGDLKAKLSKPADDFPGDIDPNESLNRQFGQAA